MMKLNEGTNVEIVLPELVNPNYSLPDPALLQVYKDKYNRVLWMLDEVEQEVFDWVDFILDMNREDKNKPIEERKPIKCIIYNWGGDLEKARMLSNIIQLSKTPVHGVCIGVCASAASIVYLSCHKRFALPNSTFLFHQGHCNNLSGSYGELNAFMKDYQDKIAEMIERHDAEILSKLQETLLGRFANLNGADGILVEDVRDEIIDVFDEYIN